MSQVAEHTDASKPLRQSAFTPAAIERRQQAQRKLQAAYSTLAWREARAWSGPMAPDAERAHRIGPRRPGSTGGPLEGYGAPVAIDPSRPAAEQFADGDAREQSWIVKHQPAARSDAESLRDALRQSRWTLRAHDAGICGQSAVAYARPASGAEPVPVVGKSGCLVCLVVECGGRLCPNCAARASRRNTKKLRGAIAELTRRQRAGIKGQFSLQRLAELEAAEKAAAFVAALYALERSEEGFSAEVRRRTRNAEHAELLADGWPPAWPVDERNGIAASVYLAASRRAVGKAHKLLAAAGESEDAHRAWAEAQSRVGRAKAAAARQAKRCPPAASVGVRVVDGICLPTVVLSALHARDAARLPGVEARAAAGEARALSSLRRLADASASRAHAAAVRAWEKTAVAVALEVARAEHERDDARALLASTKTFRKHDVMFLTLTQRGTVGESAADAMARLRSALLELARSGEWRRHCAGATWKLEAEWSTPDTRAAKAREQRRAIEVASGDRREALERSVARLEASSSWATSGCWWHVHAHLLASTGYWEQSEIKALWAEASGTTDVGAFIVRPDGDIARELSKYLSKPLANRSMSVDTTAELLEAIDGRRLLWTTGCFRGVALADLMKRREKLVGANDGDVVGLAGDRAVSREDVRSTRFDAWTPQQSLPFDAAASAEAAALALEPSGSWSAVEWRRDETAQAAALEALQRWESNKPRQQAHDADWRQVALC